MGLLEGQGSILEAKAQMALGVALGSAAAAASLPQGERAVYLEGALQALEASVGLDPTNPDTLYNLGLLQVRV